MSLLLPQTRTGTARRVAPVSIHGDRYVDLEIALDDSPERPVTGRVPASECPADLAAGERIAARFVMGVVVRVERA